VLADHIPAIDIRQLDKTYVSQSRDGSLHETHALSDINLTIAQGEFICIIGASGCGKSTLLRLIAGLERDHEGTVEVGLLFAVLGKLTDGLLVAQSARLRSVRVG
jgi:ABC-type nitrate/sulfonate/bicarbonate transport system ATPase subunit